MTLLHTLRNTPWLARLALLWFALTLGVAVASPMVNPQQELVICTAAGMLKVVLADDGSATTAATSDAGTALFCPLCLVGDAPAPAAVTAGAPPHAMHLVPQGTAVPRVVPLSTTPPPARGPPQA